MRITMFIFKGLKTATTLLYSIDHDDNGINNVIFLLNRIRITLKSLTSFFERFLQTKV